MKAKYQTVLQDLDLLRVLAEFDPVLIGTPPLGIETDESDIDIACFAPDIENFSLIATENFGPLEEFTQRPLQKETPPALLTSFRFMGWTIEIFCQGVPTGRQWGVRHFHVEQRLLTLDPALRPMMKELKQSGLKTEPAFCKILGLTGDPYHALLELETDTDSTLLQIIEKARRNRIAPD